MAVLTSSLRANGAPAILAAAIGFATLQAVRPCAAADGSHPCGSNSTPATPRRRPSWSDARRIRRSPTADGPD